MSVVIESIMNRAKKLPLLEQSLEFFRILIVAMTNFWSPFTSENRRPTRSFELFYRCAIEHVTGKATEDVVGRLDYRIVKALAQLFRISSDFAGKIAEKAPRAANLCSKGKELVVEALCLWLGVLQAIVTSCFNLTKQSCKIAKAPICFARSQLIKLKPVRKVDIIVCGIFSFVVETSNANFRAFVRNVRSIVEGAKQSLDMNANISSSFLKSNGSIIGEFLNKFEVEIFYSPHRSVKIIQTAKNLLSRSETVPPQISSNDTEPEAEKIEAEKIEAEKIEAEKIEAEKIEAEKEENNSDRKNSGHEISSSCPEESPEVQIEKEIEQPQDPEPAKCAPAGETPLYNEGSAQAESTQHVESSAAEAVDSEVVNSQNESPSQEEDPKPVVQEQKSKKTQRGKKGKR